MDALDCAGRTPFHSAVENGCPINISKLLLEKAPHHVDRPSAIAGKTVLHYAAENGDAELVALLIQHHARVTVTDANGNTPEMLARGVLSRDKPSKSKAQKYKAAIQHIQKAIAVIQEAQKAKDAILEEQRKKEAEMAREEAEKDRAARRKQEEKLEAAQRRREEEEKELARLKALAADPHGHNGSGGGGNKKKKKKKGKGGQDVPPTTKEPTAPKAAINHLLDSPVLVNAPSPLGSPAPSRPSSTASPVPPALSPVVSQATPPKPAPAAPTNGPTSSTTSSIISQPKSRSQSPVLVAAPKPTVIVPSPVSKTIQPTSTPSPTIQPRPVRTSYRPSQLVVTRMADMGFPEREARKALMQTEGKFEEAIELLTTGAELVDDSEDEAEIAAQVAAEQAAREAVQESEKEAARLVAQQAAQQAAREAALEASRLKVKAAEFVPSTPISAKQKAVPATSPTNTASGKTTARAAAGDSKPSNTQQSGSSQRQNNASAQKGGVQHPVQILQRTHPMDPQAQMRSVPTQVLQRPHPHTNARSPPTANTPKSVTPGQLAPAPLPGSMLTPTPVNVTPFLPARTQPPQPPTRAPYSYGSAPVQAQSQPTPTHAPTATTDIPKFDQSSESMQQTPSTQLASNIVAGSEYQRQESAGGLGGMQQHPMIGSVVPEGSIAGTWDTQLGVHSMSPNVHQDQLQVDTTSAPSAIQSSLWGASSLLPSPMRTIAARSPNAFQSPLSAIAPAANQHLSDFQHRRAPPALLAASMDEMLRQSQMDMDLGAADGDMVKDILAMTGAIDPDDLVDSLAGYGGINPGWSDNKPNIAPSLPAVGEGRASTAPAGSKNPVASLWGYGAFVQDIVPADKSWSSTPSQRADQQAGRIPIVSNGFTSSMSSSSLDYHHQWSSGSAFHSMEVGSAASALSMYQQHSHLSPSLPMTPENGRDAQMASFIDNLFGSPGPVHVSASHPPGIGAHSRTGMTPTVSNSSIPSNAYHRGSAHDSFSGYPSNATIYDNNAIDGGGSITGNGGYLNSNSAGDDYGMNSGQSPINSMNSTSRSLLNSLGGDGYNGSPGGVSQNPSGGSPYPNSMLSPAGSSMSNANNGYSAFSSASSFSNHQAPSHSLESMYQGPGAIGGGRGSISSSNDNIGMGVGVGPIGSGSGFMNRRPSSDMSSNESPGIQALNQALAFSRYPKLNNPVGSGGGNSGPTSAAGSAGGGHDQGHGMTTTATTQAPNGAWRHS